MLADLDSILGLSSDNQARDHGKKQKKKSNNGKNVLILGDRSSGKSSILAALTRGSRVQQKPMTTQGPPLGLSYSYMNVVEDDNTDDIMARVGLYQLSSTGHPTLVPLDVALDVTELVVVIVLDWSQPWKFLDCLQRWILFLETALKSQSEQGVVDLKSKCKWSLTLLFQSYHPSEEGGNPHQEFKHVSPLDQGVLDNSIGIPLIIVCMKSDYLISLEKESGLTEETFDFIQQTLRSICLKLGASLFYASSHKPDTLDTLGRYLLHLLFASISDATDAPTMTFDFPFRDEPQVVERDVMVPLGWDSWGKIKLLREQFQVESYAHSSSLHTLLQECKVEYEKCVSEKRDPGEILNAEPLITAEDEQVFLKRQTDTLAHEPMSDTASSPRPQHVISPSIATLLSPEPSNSSFTSPVSAGGASTGLASATLPTFAASTKPTLSSNDIMEDVGAKLARLSKLKEQRNDSADRLKGLNMDSDKKAALMGAAASSSSASSQNEVLANFFQSLLTKKTPGGSPGGK